MPIRDPQTILQKLGQTTLKVDTYFLQRTGFVANQTILKLGEYNLNCVPATISVAESRFLAVLTPVEVNHFGRFKEGTHILILTFDDPENKDIARFHLRVNLVDLVPVPERKNICFLLLKLKSLPAELALFLGDYLDDLDARKQTWETLGAESADAAAAPPLLEVAARVEAGSQGVAVELVTFTTKKLALRWASGPGEWAGRTEVRLRVTVRHQALLLEGSIDAEGAFLPEFHSEWLDFIEDQRFQKSLKSRGAARTVP